MWCRKIRELNFFFQMDFRVSFLIFEVIGSDAKHLPLFIHFTIVISITTNDFCFCEIEINFYFIYQYDIFAYSQDTSESKKLWYFTVRRLLLKWCIRYLTRGSVLIENDTWYAIFRVPEIVFENKTIFSKMKLLVHFSLSHTLLVNFTKVLS